MSRRKKAVSHKPEEATIESYQLTLTRAELSHLRDLLSVVLPPDGELTISAVLAEVNGSQSDAVLWSKIWNLCITAKLPVGDEAPNFAVAPAGPQELSVFHFEQEES